MTSSNSIPDSPGPDLPGPDPASLPHAAGSSLPPTDRPAADPSLPKPQAEDPQESRPQQSPSQSPPAAQAEEPVRLGALAKRMGPAAILAGLSLCLPPLGLILLLTFMNPIGEWLRSHDGAGIAIYAGGFALLSGLALVPTYASAILGGWAFGPSVGFPAALCGYLGGAIIGYLIGRAGSGDRVDRIIKEKPKWEAVRHSLVGCGFWRTLLIVTLVRLPPNSPFALTNLVLSSVKTNIFAYVLGTLLGMAPRTGVVLYVASQFSDLTAHDAATHKKPIWLLGVGAILAIAVLVVIGKIANKALHQVTRSARPPAGPASERLAKPG